MVDIKCLTTECDSYIWLFSESKFSLTISFSFGSSLLEFSSEKETEMSDDLTQVRRFSRINTSDLPPSSPPQILNFTANPSNHLIIYVNDETHDYNLIEIISETNEYANRYIHLNQRDNDYFKNRILWSSKHHVENPLTSCWYLRTTYVGGVM